MLDFLLEVTDFQLRQNLLGTPLVVPRFFVLHASQEFLQSGIARCLHTAFVLFNQLHRTVAMIQPGFQNSQLFRITGALLQIAYPQIAPEGNLSFVVPFFSGQYIEQGSLSASVLRNQPDTLSLCNAKRNPVEQHQIAERLR